MLDYTFTYYILYDYFVCSYSITCHFTNMWVFLHVKYVSDIRVSKVYKSFLLYNQAYYGLIWFDIV